MTPLRDPSRTLREIRAVPEIPEIPWAAFLVSDARAAQRAAESLQRAERRLDGPFYLWEGQIPGACIAIVVCEPGGPSAWFAAAKLILRRRAPLLIAGATPMIWIAAPPAPDYLAATALEDMGAESERSQELICDSWTAQSLAQALRGEFLPGGSHPAGESATRKSVAMERVAHYPLDRGGAGDPLTFAALNYCSALECEAQGLIEAAREEKTDWAIAGPVIEFQGDVITQLRPPRGTDASREISGRLGCALARMIETRFVSEALGNVD